MTASRVYSSYPSDPNAPTGGYGYGEYADTSGTSWLTSANTTTSVTMVYRPQSATYASDPVVYAPDLVEDWEMEPLNKVASREAHKWAVRRSREKSPAPLTTQARHGFQQMARVPCYRGARIR